MIDTTYIIVNSICIIAICIIHINTIKTQIEIKEKIKEIESRINKDV